MSLTVFSKLMLNYLKKKECKKGNCEPVKSVTKIYVHVYRCSSVSLSLSLYVSLYFSVSFSFSLSLSVSLSWTAKKGGQWTDPVGQLVRCLYVAEARSSVLSVTLRALAASIYLCAYTCAYTVHIALCISRIHIPAPNLFPHTSTERSAEIRSSKFLDTGEFRRITWTGS